MSTPLGQAQAAAAAGDLGRWRAAVHLAQEQDLPAVPLCTLAMSAQVDLETGSPAGAEATIAAAAAAQPGRNETEWRAPAALEVVRATVALYAGQPWDQTCSAVESILAELGDDLEPEVATQAHGSRAWAAALAGHADQDRCIDVAVQAMDGLDDAAMSRSVLGVHLVVQAALSGQRLADAERLALRLRDVADRSGLRHLLPILDVTLARSELFQGRLHDASRRLRSAVEQLGVEEGGVHLALGLATLGYVDAMLDDDESVRRTTAGVIALAATEPPSLLRTGSLLFSAHALATIGSRSEAVPLLLEAGGGPTLPLLPAVDRPYGFEVLCAAALDDDDLDLARHWTEQAYLTASGPMATAAAERAAAGLAGAGGNHGSACAAAGRARRASDAAGGRLEATRARLLEGMAHSARGQRVSAVSALLRVHHDAAELGAAGVRAAATRHLRRLGRRVPVSQRDPLSIREIEVAKLVATGSTNRSIGAQLFISERTVESHVANLLVKLGVPSRSALAALLLGRVRVGPDHPLDRTSLSGLTPRQSEVASIVADGNTNREVASALGLSVKTVEHHVSAILCRLGIGARSGIGAALRDRRSG